MESAGCGCPLCIAVERKYALFFALLSVMRMRPPEYLHRTYRGERGKKMSEKGVATQASAKLIEGLISLSEEIVEMSGLLSRVTAAIESRDELRTRKILADIVSREDKADALFEDVATKIMETDLPSEAESDRLLDSAKSLDRISDLIGRAALLFNYLSSFSSSEMFELLGAGTAQVNLISSDLTSVLRFLDKDSKKVRELCGRVSGREKVLDGLRGRFNTYAIQKMGKSEYRIWLKDIFSNLDEIADTARDLTVTLRVIAIRIEKQRGMRKSGTPSTPAK